MTLLDLVLPTRCLACEHWTDVGELGLCRHCSGRLRRHEGARCRGCGALLSSGSARADRSHCGRCLRRPPAHEVLHVLYSYEEPFDRVIQALKFRGMAHLGDVLARSLWDRYAESLRRCEVVVPIPLPPWRRLQRGYNQAEVIGRALGHHLERPLVHPLRRRQGAPQSDQASTSQRRRNIRRTLRLRPRARRLVSGRRVLVVDDVTTSGATISRACRLLRKAGATELVVAVAGRRSEPATLAGRR